MSDLDRLFYWRGIAPDFYNYRGELVNLPIENRLTLLQTMGVNTDSEEEISSAAYSLDVAPWLSWFPPLVLGKQGTEAGFSINLHPDDLAKTFTWTLVDESRETLHGLFVPSNCPEIGDYEFEGVRYSRRLISIPNLDLGYYRLSVSCDKKSQSTTLAITPNQAFVPSFLDKEERCWGVIVQLYTLRSESDWGIGDFSVLKQLVNQLAKLGADTIGLNPLHALLPDLKHKCSPYSPSDRRFLCPLYIDVTCEPEYSFCESRESDVDYCVNSGDVLKMFALYEGVNKRWPSCSYSIPLTQDELEAAIGIGYVQDLILKNQDVILFHSYLQWVSHCQLSAVQSSAAEQGMKLGLIRDLAVGADGSGAEVSSNPSLFCRGASVGAPPDPLAEQGQNWGIPPMDPADLRQTGFEHYVNLLRENMSLCGALRIDHAMSLMRLWWCPPGKTADHGAYVYYPFEEMIGILSLESQRNKCLIIGEDLGVVPEEFRVAMRERRIYSNKVFYFEKADYDKFKPPADYETFALAMINNHDVPTLSSWWSASDLKLRDKLNIFEEGVTYEQAFGQRQSEKSQLLNLLEEGSCLPENWADRDIDKPVDLSLIHALLSNGANVSSQIYVIQLEDLLMMEAPVNVPGTYLEYPNWQRRIPKTVSEIFESEKTLTLLKDINTIRSGM